MRNSSNIAGIISNLFTGRAEVNRNSQLIPLEHPLTVSRTELSPPINSIY